MAQTPLLLASASPAHWLITAWVARWQLIAGRGWRGLGAFPSPLGCALRGLGVLPGLVARVRLSCHHLRATGRIGPSALGLLRVGVLALDVLLAVDVLDARLTLDACTGEDLGARPRPLTRQPFCFLSLTLSVPFAAFRWPLQSVARTRGSASLPMACPCLPPFARSIVCSLP